VYARETAAAGNLALPDDLFAWRPSCHLKDGDALGEALLAWNKSQPALLVVWAPSWETGQRPAGEAAGGQVERFCQRMSGRPTFGMRRLARSPTTFARPCIEIDPPRKPVRVPRTWRVGCAGPPASPPLNTLPAIDRTLPRERLGAAYDVSEMKPQDTSTSPAAQRPVAPRMIADPFFLATHAVLRRANEYRKSSLTPATIRCERCALMSRYSYRKGLVFSSPHWPSPRPRL